MTQKEPHHKWIPVPDWVYDAITNELRQGKLNTWLEVDARKWVLLYSKDTTIVHRKKTAMKKSMLKEVGYKKTGIRWDNIAVYDNRNIVRVKLAIEKYLLLFGDS